MHPCRRLLCFVFEAEVVSMSAKGRMRRDPREGRAPDRSFRDRRDAGRVLAGLLEHYQGRCDVVVLGLARGGVPVAYEIARALAAPLDVLVVRKLGVPDREELAMGAIASGGIVVVNDDLIRGLDIVPEVIQRIAEREGRELIRRELVGTADRCPTSRERP
jgi:predicted phosphoribosyltransferase